MVEWCYVLEVPTKLARGRCGTRWPTEVHCCFGLCRYLEIGYWKHPLWCVGFWARQLGWLELYSRRLEAIICVVALWLAMDCGGYPLIQLLVHCRYNDGRRRKRLVLTCLVWQWLIRCGTSSLTVAQAIMMVCQISRWQSWVDSGNLFFFSQKGQWCGSLVHFCCIGYVGNLLGAVIVVFSL